MHFAEKNAGCKARDGFRASTENISILKLRLHGSGLGTTNVTKDDNLKETNNY
jgi:hypothetical protein